MKCPVVRNPAIRGRSAAAGEACVSALAHDTQEVINQAYYQYVRHVQI